MERYLETFFRHRRLLAVPVLVILLVAVSVVVSRPPEYQSQARLWVERPTLVTNPNANPYITPAQEQSAVVAELVATRYFCLQVGEQSGLTASLAAARDYPDPIRPWLRGLGVPGLHGAAQPTQGEVQSEVFDIIRANTVAYAAGPEIMVVSFVYNDPVLAQSVARAVVSQYLAEVSQGQRVQAKAAEDFYSQQAIQAEADLSTADANVYAFLSAHPEQRSDTAIASVDLIRLRRNDDDARQRLAGIVQKLDEAKLNLAAIDTDGASGIRVLDAADRPGASTISKRVLLTAIGGSLGLALIVLVLGVLTLALTDATLRRPKEVEDLLGATVVGTVPRVA